MTRFFASLDAILDRTKKFAELTADKGTKETDLTVTFCD